MNKKVIIFDVDGTIEIVEHSIHFLNQKPADWKSFRAETVNDTPVEHVCDIAKRFIAQGDEVAFFSARNESEREVTEKQISEWIGDNHKGVFLRPMMILDVMQNSNLTLQTNSKSWVVKSTLSLTIEIKSLICGEIEEPPVFK